jgi:hypothetical protein
MSEKEMMDAWMKAAAVGPQHELLATHVGTWNAALKMTMDPTQPAQEFTGTAKYTMIMGGRFLQEEFESSMGGMPFNGLGTTGFDNLTGKFWLTWIDNAATGILWANGSLSEDGKVLTLNGKVNKAYPPELGADMKCVYRLISPDKFIFETYDKVGTPQEFRSMEITYTRK